MVPAIAIHHQRVKDDKCLNSIRSQEPLEGSFWCWRQMPKSKQARVREARYLEASSTSCWACGATGGQWVGSKLLGPATQLAFAQLKQQVSDGVVRNFIDGDLSLVTHQYFL